MNTIEAMKKYIQRTKMPNTLRYDLVLPEMNALCDLIKCRQIWNAIELAFEYGRAKGYRIAKREVSNG